MQVRSRTYEHLCEIDLYKEADLRNRSFFLIETELSFRHAQNIYAMVKLIQKRRKQGLEHLYFLCFSKYILLSLYLL